MSRPIFSILERIFYKGIRKGNSVTLLVPVNIICAELQHVLILKVAFALWLIMNDLNFPIVFLGKSTKNHSFACEKYNVVLMITYSH